MKYTIYSITHRASGKMYIGFTEDVESRWIAHKRTAEHSSESRPIHNALQKHGADAFDFKVLEQTADKQEALRLETYYIRRFNTFAPNGYNLTTGGEPGGWSAVHSAAILQRNYEKIRQMFIWLRENPEIQKNDLARRLGVTPPTITNWLKKYQPADVGL